MAKWIWQKGGIERFKKAPAATMVKKAVNSAVDYLGLNIPASEPESRNDHFKFGSMEHLQSTSDKPLKTQMVINHPEDQEHAAHIVDEHLSKGLYAGPYTRGNVSSIMNAYEIKNRKPEGY